MKRVVTVVGVFGLVGSLAYSQVAPLPMGSVRAPTVGGDRSQAVPVPGLKISVCLTRENGASPYKIAIVDSSGRLSAISLVPFHRAASSRKEFATYLAPGPHTGLVDVVIPQKGLRFRFHAIRGGSAAYRLQLESLPKAAVNRSRANRL